jgi:ribose 5-phosphate isomerase A
MNTDEMRQAVAKAALDYIPDNCIIGVGTGNTVNFFIEALISIKHKIEGTVASSLATETRLKALKIPVFDLNAVNEISVYIDSADAYNPYLQLVKGGGGALTREKILAATSEQFICIVDEKKSVKVFGEFPIPIEIIPMARSFVAREIVKLGGRPVYREHFSTDNGNIIIDVHDWLISEPIKLETQINAIPGVVCCGLFAAKPADMLLVGTAQGVQEVKSG